MDSRQGITFPLRGLRAFSFPEFLILCVLLFFTAFVALPAAYPYLKKAHRQAHVIKNWEKESAAMMDELKPR